MSKAFQANVEENFMAAAHSGGAKAPMGTNVSDVRLDKCGSNSSGTGGG